MKAPVLFGPDRRKLQLGTRIGKGGEGEVYALDGRPDRAVKIYTVADTSSRSAKIRAMIDAELAKQSNLVAFPIEVVTDEGGRFAGFTMLKVSDHEPLHEVYSPGARKSAFPEADYRFLVRAATNIARAVAAVHAAGCVIGDINHSGILVSDKATVALIDADSFQVTKGTAQHLCRVGVPEYTPPELQGKKLDGVVRTPNHDAFGLAVVIFQLLWMGRHPYSGRFDRGEMPIERAIGEHRFVYSEARSVGMTPPPAVPRLKDFPPQIRTAFEAAFNPAANRPTARQWVALLTELESALGACAKSPLHHHPRSGECPWCRMEGALGVQLFLPRLPKGSGFASAPGTIGDLASLWKAIEAVPPPPPISAEPALRSPAITPSNEAQAAKGGGVWRKIGGLLVLGAAGALIVYAPFLWFIWIGVGLFGLNLLFTEGDVGGSIVNDAASIERQWLEALQHWRDRNGSHEFDAAKSELAAIKREFDGLAADEKRRIDDYNSHRKNEQLTAYLEGFQIRKYKLHGIGPSRLATLTSYGIETAKDVTANAVLRVPGMGQVTSQPLLEWRKRIESRFIYVANPTPLDQIKIGAIQAETRARAAALRAKLHEGPKRLSALAATIQARRGVPDGTLQRLHEKRLQAHADLKFLGKALPHVPAPARPRAPPAAPSPPRPSPQPTTKPNTTSGQSNSSPTAAAKPGVQCPQCSSRMVLRMARRGSNRGRRFWGCSRYPSCKGTRSV